MSDENPFGDPFENAFDTPDDGPDRRVERTDVGASIETTITRGTGTRDQEKYKLKGKGATAGEALDEFEAMLSAVEAEFAERIRALQPTEDDTEDDNE